MAKHSSQEFRKINSQKAQPKNITKIKVETLMKIDKRKTLFKSLSEAKKTDLKKKLRQKEKNYIRR